MLLGGVQGWFGAPAFARFVSNTVRIGADDILTRIGALMDWRWHPEAGVCVLNCGWISCYFAAVPDATTHCRFRNPR
ncbi:MAG: hypothetical protein GDA36_02340 [Rhodobacteraceae bacterium]|nr:hypothetical protein [Paracoccaceae bacterium]